MCVCVCVCVCVCLPWYFVAGCRAEQSRAPQVRSSLYMIRLISHSCLTDLAIPFSDGWSACPPYDGHHLPPTTDLVVLCYPTPPHPLNALNGGMIMRRQST
ncbi:hypothetical protein BO70DRAFT_34291 [Aspergillus heteromorphus CBS 117.55]|uniref:Secreted protein n=1 Tax=Aspergillus heteromorphus CBS 117.55 TaxID=1448321 RepID=A0A317WDD3_9EURO|nr:uncharacterized protein BO70DRAFT_34291 [Aspergillus heteromorphus CBS 117.55]PWY83038.1 hypothetical protein BO70DRAFT_34291 [Aspergillus heteromorphus CBS 117.55]